MLKGSLRYRGVAHRALNHDKGHQNRCVSSQEGYHGADPRQVIYSNKNHWGDHTIDFDPFRLVQETGRSGRITAASPFRRRQAYTVFPGPLLRQKRDPGRRRTFYLALRDEAGYQQ
jgi:hypothetical protein